MGLSARPRPLEALLSNARAWEMESRDGAVRSSSRESDRQMGSGGDAMRGGWRAEVTAGLEVMVRGSLLIHKPSYKRRRRRNSKPEAAIQSELVL